MPRAPILMMLVSVLGSTLTAAQTCRGSPAFRGRPLQVFAGALLGDHQKSYDAGVAVVSTRAFGELQVGGIDFDAFTASSFTFGGGAGYQIPLSERGTVQLCPTVGVKFARGPTNINGEGLDYSETDFSFGLEAGVVTTDPGQQFQLVPTGSIALANAATKLAGPFSVYTTSTAFGVVRLGIGLAVREEVSVTPYVSHAFGPSGTSMTFGLTMRFTLGGARTSALTGRATSCGGLATTDSATYDTTQVTERPSLRSAPEPRYPTLQRDFGIEGRVILAVVVGPDGTPDVSSVRIVQKVDSVLDAEALRWITHVSYWPACRGGRPVRALIVQPVDFCRFRCPRNKS